MESTLNNYLNAKSLDDALVNLSEDFLLFFNSKEGEGIPKSDLNSILEWDYALNPKYEIVSMKTEGNKIVVELKEENDFSQSIGFPGWKAEVTFTFDEENLIQEQLYVPDPDQPDYRDWLNPAIDWLKENRPEDLKTVFDEEEDQIIYNGGSAKKWVELLEDWKNQSS